MTEEVIRKLVNADASLSNLIAWLERRCSSGMITLDFDYDSLVIDDFEDECMTQKHFHETAFIEIIICTLKLWPEYIFNVRNIRGVYVMLFNF